MKFSHARVKGIKADVVKSEITVSFLPRQLQLDLPDGVTMTKLEISHVPSA